MAIRRSVYTAILGCMLAFVRAPASPLFPGINAASSANGRFLVTSEFVLTDPDPASGARQLKGEIFHVLRQITVTERDRFNTTATLWAGIWDLKLGTGIGSPLRGAECIFPLVTDDGQFVVIVIVNPAISGTLDVLAIYRQEDFGARLVRTVKLNEIRTLPAPLNDDIVRSFSDASPQWFTGGAFSFSADSTQLLFKTEAGQTVTIALDPQNK